MYCLVLDKSAKIIFRSSKFVWRGESMPRLIADAIGGTDNYVRCIPAQDPLSGGASEGQVIFQMNPSAEIPYFVTLGIVFDEEKVKS